MSNWTNEFTSLLDAKQASNKPGKARFTDPNYTRPKATLSRIKQLLKCHMENEDIWSIWIDLHSKKTVTDEQNNRAVLFSEYLALKFGNEDGAVEFAATAAEHLAGLEDQSIENLKLHQFLLSFRQVIDE